MPLGVAFGGKDQKAKKEPREVQRDAVNNIALVCETDF